jgi:serine/threonine-protein kinase
VGLSTLDVELAQLVSEGRHDEAAQRARAAGQPLRAAELYAAVWKYADAIACARAGGALAEAYRYALLAREPRTIAGLLEELAGVPGEARAAARIAEDRQRHGDAAQLAYGAGDTAEAARLFETAGELARAGQCRLALGEARAAGMLFERHLKDNPDDAESALALGQILVSMGRTDHAARVLQRVEHVESASQDDVRAARRLLVASFAAMGMSEAAADVLDRLRETDPKLPASVPEMLEATFGDPRGLVTEAQRELVLGRYRVLGTIGEGGAGRVLRAEDTFYGRTIALKALRAAGGATGRDALARFAREANVAMAIEHPNVVRVLAYHPEGPYLAMELMEGGTLEERLGPLDAPKGPLAPSAAVAIARAMLRGLEAVHRRGVVHRDLKPANVLFSAAGEAKIGDFGVAHLIDLGATMTGAMQGTLATMAPEQISGRAQPDASTDLYAVGIVLHRMLTGAMPFESTDLAAAHLDEAPIPPSRQAPWLDGAIDAIVFSLLEKEQAARPTSASDVLARLEALPMRAYEEAFAARSPAAGSVGPRRSSAPPPATAVDARFADARYELDGTMRATDTLLARPVELRVVDDLEHVRRWAAVRSPFVQAVLALEEGRVVLERAEGEQRGGPPSRADLERALAAIEAAGLVHGAIEPAHVVVTRVRTFLRVPVAPATPGARDREALERLCPPSEPAP